jgi:acetylornithine deacetylase
MTPLEEQVLASVSEVELLEDLAALVAIRSVDGTSGEAEVQAWCADRMRGMGMDVDHWRIDVEEATGRPGFPGMEVGRDELWGCVGQLGTGEPALALCGHTDVVPADPASFHDGEPFRLHRVGPVVLGRGACDMKGGVAAVLAAVSAVVRSAAPLARPVAVHCVSAEEDGGLGAWSTLRRGHTAGCCVIAEPTQGRVVPANAGSLTFTVTVPGLAAHGSMRTSGVSAVDKLTVVLAALRDLERSRNAVVPAEFAHLDLAWPLSVGVVRAGDWASTVPDRLVAEGRYGVRPDETTEQAKHAFEDRLGSLDDPWLEEHPPTVEWTGGVFAPGAVPRDSTPVAMLTSAVADVVGRRPEVVGAPYGSDLRHYVAAGVPTAQYGPGQVRHAHAADEQVEVAELLACAKVYAVMVLRCCRDLPLLTAGLSAGFTAG